MQNVHLDTLIAEKFSLFLRLGDLRNEWREKKNQLSTKKSELKYMQNVQTQHDTKLKKLKEKIRWLDTVFGSEFAVCTLIPLTVVLGFLLLPITFQLIMGLGIVGGVLSGVLLGATSTFLTCYSIKRFFEEPSSEIKSVTQLLKDSKEKCAELMKIINQLENTEFPKMQQQLRREYADYQSLKSRIEELSPSEKTGRTVVSPCGLFFANDKEFRDTIAPLEESCSQDSVNAHNI